MEIYAMARAHEARPSMNLQTKYFSVDFETLFHTMQDANKLKICQTTFYAVLNASKLEIY